MTTTYHRDRRCPGDGFTACALSGGGGAAAAPRSAARLRGALRVRPGTRTGARRGGAANPGRHRRARGRRMGGVRGFFLFPQV